MLADRGAAMALVGGWLLVMHYLDVYWIVMPDAPTAVGSAFWLDAGALLFIAGIASLTWDVRRRGEPAVAQRDPAFTASLDYRTGS